MTDKENYQKLGDAFLQELWRKREKGIPLPPIDWSGPIRHQDVLYLLNQYPFLQIMSTEPVFEEEMHVQLITAQSGWTIHDYGIAMSASPGKFLYGSYSSQDFQKEEDEGGEGAAELAAGQGSVVNIAFMTAQEMIALAITKGWPGVEIIAGTPIMQWAAWMKAQDHEYTLSGYEPTRADKERRQRIVKMRGETPGAPTPKLEL